MFFRKRAEAEAAIVNDTSKTGVYRPKNRMLHIGFDDKPPKIEDVSSNTSPLERAADPTLGLLSTIASALTFGKPPPTDSDIILARVRQKALSGQRLTPLERNLLEHNHDSDMF